MRVRDLAKHTIYDMKFIAEGLLFLVCIGLAVLLAGNRIAYQKTVELGQQNNQILKEVQSCTLPNGPCAIRGQSSTQEARDNINGITVAAAYCAAKLAPPANPQLIKKCVEETLPQVKP